MRKITSNILIALFILCFASLESFAFTNPWKNSNPKCKKFDFYCKRTSPKISAEEVEKMPKEESRNDTDKRAKMITDKTDKNNTELNIFSGMFDFSDGKQRSGIFGLQHQNEDLFRNSSIGKLSPITGGFLTEKNAFYLYTGVQAEYDLGLITITPSFAPGYYNYGNGKDLGHPLEFKTEIQMTYGLGDSTHLGMSYNHISNASLGTKNPGANSYIFNFLKQF